MSVTNNLLLLPRVSSHASKGRSFSAGAALAEKCDKYVLDSPYPDIPAGPYPSLSQFVSKQWKTNADKVAIVDGHTQLSRTFGDYAARTAAWQGLWKQHDTMALFSPNHVDYAPTVLSVAASTKSAVTPANPMFTRYELERILTQSQATAMVVHESTLETALKAQHQSAVRDIYVLTDESDDSSGTNAALPYGVTAMNDVWKEHTPSDGDNDDDDDGFSDQQTVVLPYSSGTTGLPKGVCLSHANLIAQLWQLYQIDHSVFPPDHKVLCTLPFFHIYAFVVGMLYAAWQGQTLITSSMRKFDYHAFCQLIERHQPKRAFLVPPLVLGLSKQADLWETYNLSSLQVLNSAAAPLSNDLEQAVVKQMRTSQTRHNAPKKAIVKQGWGMSELSPAGTHTHDDRVSSGSVGPVVSNTQAKIIDPLTGDSLPPHTTGELVLRGPQVMKGYQDNPTATAECLSHTTGWFRSGDLAHYDEDGMVYITDRLKELIKVRGYPVAPAELEALLLTHPAVADAAVIGAPDDVSGELPRAYVVLQQQSDDDEANTSEADLYEFVRQHAAPYKRLDGGVVLTESIPKSASGKILRRLLRDQLREELETTSAA